MAEGGKILSEILRQTIEKAKEGETTRNLDKFAENLALRYKSESAFKGFYGFPSALCASLNSQIVHGVPDNRELRRGDILSLDMGIKYKGFYADMARTIYIGEPEDADFEALRLIKATKKALKVGIKKARAGNTFGDVGNTIQRFLEGQKFRVIRDLCGHGVGKQLHEEPQILNYGRRGEGEEIKPGMVFCLEPMASLGDWRIKKGRDGFSFETKDGSISAHFEDMVAIGQNGEPKTLTK